MVPAHDLEYWSSLGRLEEVRVAPAKGAEVNQRGQADFTALHAAAENGHLDVLRLLIERGTELSPRDTSGLQLQ